MPVRTEIRAVAAVACALGLLAAGIALTSTSVFAVGTSLETDAEKFSYAFGINFTQSMMRQGAPLDADAVYMAVKDALAGSEPRLSAEAMDNALSTLDGDEWE